MKNPYLPSREQRNNQFLIKLEKDMNNILDAYLSKITKDYERKELQTQIHTG